MALGGVVKAAPETDLINPLPVVRTVSVADAPVVTEPASGFTPATFVILVQGAPLRGTETVRVSWKTEDGTATGGSDYTSAAGSVLFVAGGPTSQTVPVAVLADGAVDSQAVETFNLRLGHVIGAVLVDGVGLGQIRDRDRPVDPPPPPPPPCPEIVQPGAEGVPFAHCDEPHDPTHP